MPQRNSECAQHPHPAAPSLHRFQALGFFCRAGTEGTRGQRGQEQEGSGMLRALLAAIWGSPTAPSQPGSTQVTSGRAANLSELQI